MKRSTKHRPRAGTSGLRTPLGVAALVALLGANAACASCARDKPTPVEQPPPIEPVVVDPPVIDPPAAGPDAWQMPPLEHQEPGFPLLPDEDRAGSRSIGGVAHGWLVDAHRIPIPHPHVGVLPIQLERGLIYTTDEMWELVENASRHVREQVDDARLYVGNFSARGGGDIPYSVSHNSGRDADLAFYAVDEFGNSVMPPNLLPFDADGKYVPEEGKEGPTLYFDTARNWLLIEGLVEHGWGALQYIFISTPLKKMLLDHATAIGVEKGVIRRAKALLVQPSGTLPHDDHFHLRIYCSARDVASGCKNGGRVVGGFSTHSKRREEAVAAAQAALASDNAAQRRDAIERLSLLRASKGAQLVASALSDGDPEVRAAAARALGGFETGSKPLAARLVLEEHPIVVVELIFALSEVGGSTSAKALAGLFEEERILEIDALGPTDVRLLAADAAIPLEDARIVGPMVRALDGAPADVSERMHQALTHLTNIDPTVERKPLPAEKKEKRRNKRKKKAKTKPGPDLSPEELRASTWAKWYAEHRKEGRDEWLVAGFVHAGYPVEGLSIDQVWNIAPAVAGLDHSSYNAQRTFMRLSGKTPASLSWSKADASFYWRRWFERRCGRLGCPDPPDELSTLDPEERKAKKAAKKGTSKKLKRKRPKKRRGANKTRKRRGRKNK